MSSPTCAGCGATGKPGSWEPVFVNATFGRGGSFRDFCPDCSRDGTVDRFCNCADRRQRFEPTRRQPALHIVT